MALERPSRIFIVTQPKAVRDDRILVRLVCLSLCILPGRALARRAGVLISNPAIGRPARPGRRQKEKAMDEPPTNS